MKEKIIPRGVAFCEIEQDASTESYAFVLMPSLSMNALSSAIEPLRIANQLTRKNLFEWRCVSENQMPVKCSNGLEISVDGSICDIETREIVIVCSGILPKSLSSIKVANEIRKFWRRGQIVGGLCTGAYTLAQAGILYGSSVTLHWENLPAFQELYPDIEATEQLYKFSDRIWTCAGGMAATDMMISRIRHLHGSMLSGLVTSMCLHQLPRAEAEPQKMGSAAALSMRHPALIKVTDYIESNLDEEKDLNAIAKQNGISRRQMERMFRKYLSTTPNKFIKQLRLHRSRALMAETNLAIAEVAALCGFNSTTHFSKSFKEQFGVSPFRFLQTERYISQ